MENQLITTKDLFSQGNIQDRFEKLLGEKSAGFISSVLQVVNNNKLLSKAKPVTVLNAAATAASLDLPINQSLGFAWIVPYKGEAQFQIGWKGFVQLALRTGQYSRINVTEVFENQFKSFNRMTEELDCEFSIEGSGDIVGYAAYFKLLNGMEKTVYWTNEKVIIHAKKYSQAYGTKFSPWSDKDQFHEMAKKTVLKNMLSKWGIMSIEMQTAQFSDQSTQENENEFTYPDNTIDIEAKNVDEENDRIKMFIDSAKTSEDLNSIREQLEGAIDDKIEIMISNRENEIILTQETK